MILIHKSKSELGFASVVHHYKMKLPVFLSLIIIVISSSSCSSTPSRYNHDKQDVFIAQFSEGMSEKEVYQILGQTDDFRLNKRIEQDNGDIWIEVITESDDWGSPIYFFRFSPDDQLIVVFPPDAPY